MKDARPALRYAKAILNLAKESSAETEVNADMQLIAATISENLDLRVMLKSPVIKSSEKKKVLNTLFTG
ncbi:F0F1 ATP synthase subunit delta, partial [Flavobacteriaceae bacterium]|nr:F0F1 ATP synthase subunit delta [Flavobacteriaceae bacterium]